MDRILKILFFALIVRPIVFVVLGLNVRGKPNLPTEGPAVIAANHNSHLDTMVLMSLYPLSKLHQVRPVAAADYFLKNRFLSWFALKCVGIIPINRTGRQRKRELFAGCHSALDNSEILILFPEGSRGNPEEMSEIKRGIYHIVNDRNDTRVTPVMLHGLGRALPRGEALLVPFNCDVIIGDQLPKAETAEHLVNAIQDSFLELQKYCITRSQV
ncbi:MAG: 1-acyl-sn-glycerol-3-phosphate acyltransferase [Planctomycetes bacterium]|nr:1-acyl-sn-glycerol-3-phosphate acyltransferase [Planctomycetota bacterium]MCH9726872.1 1-acyl-sn-glycerol-3-phosphate acyltransferase [Planctomycetota bacterium]MCH9775556.1 1-acyl-sn-glycerol-3-phosphate acyltransferase [Planctomycetota bacterium]MCH9792487.1 1-acyl-sn-glycerol-3-phosphate acyltransferase [Planctomycetota bacterium]MDF1743248.1 lysophospholipid acyltransferase family protein [Gimesia sp.]